MKAKTAMKSSTKRPTRKAIRTPAVPPTKVTIDSNLIDPDDDGFSLGKFHQYSGTLSVNGVALDVKAIEYDYCRESPSAEQADWLMAEIVFILKSQGTILTEAQHAAFLYFMIDSESNIFFNGGTFDLDTIVEEAKLDKGDMPPPSNLVIPTIALHFDHNGLSGMTELVG